MSCKILKSKNQNKSLLPSKTASLSSMSSKDTKKLETFYNVSYTDYCGLSLKNRIRTEGQLPSQSLNFKRKSQEFWKNQKKYEPTLERGDSFRVEPVRICDSPRGRHERVKTEYAHPKIFRTNKNKSFMDFYKTYELEFLQKKFAGFEAEGHKLQLARFNGLDQRQRKGILRPNTAYLKRINPQLYGDSRKIKTLDLNSLNNLKRKEQSFFAICGWQGGFDQNQL